MFSVMSKVGLVGDMLRQCQPTGTVCQLRSLNLRLLSDNPSGTSVRFAIILS